MNTKRRIGKDSLIGQINVVPLIDILLVLLIIFMITSENINSNVDLSLPKAISKKSAVSKSVNNMMVSIDAKQQIVINDNKFDKIDDVEKFLKSTGNTENDVVILSDSSVPYQRLVEVLVALNNNGHTKIKMAYKNN